MAMDASLNYLINIVGSELKHAENIYNFLVEKENVLINNNSGLLKNMIYKEHKLFVKSRELEVSRVAALEVVAKKFNIPLKKISLSLLAEKAGENYRNTIFEVRNKFLKLLEKIRHQNLKCEMLLKKSMELIGYSMSLIYGSVRQKTKMVYNKHKKPEEKYYQNSILDRRG